jgi:hypothetical protein
LPLTKLIKVSQSTLSLKKIFWLIKLLIKWVPTTISDRTFSSCESWCFLFIYQGCHSFCGSRLLAWTFARIWCLSCWFDCNIISYNTLRFYGSNFSGYTSVFISTHSITCNSHWCFEQIFICLSFINNSTLLS